MPRTIDTPRAAQDEDQWMKRINLRVQRNDRATEEAIEEVLDTKKYLAIGTAVTSRLHHPMPAMRANTEIDKPRWSYRMPDATPEGTEPMLRAGSIINTAIHSAFGGDINVIQQRIVADRLLVPEFEFYQGGTYGWEWNADTQEYELMIHEGYFSRTDHIPNDTHIGDIDFVRNEGFDISVPDEPYHYASLDVHERVGSIPITMGVARRNIGRSAIQLINYPPLSVPSAR